MSVTPLAPPNSSVPNSGTPVTAIPANPVGGFITNPLTAADQGIATAEPLYISIVGDPALAANGTTFALQPGQTWNVVSEQTTPTRVDAPTNGHKFSATYW